MLVRKKALRVGYRNPDNLMASLELNVTIHNQTGNSLTLVSGPTGIAHNIPAGGSTDYHASSNWSAINSMATYKIDGSSPEAEAHFSWYVQLVGTNSFSAGVTPDGSSYQATWTHDKGFHVKATYTLKG